MSGARDVLMRLVLTAVIAIVVVGLSGILPLLAPSGGGIAAGPDHPEYDPERLAPQRLDTDGKANPEGNVGVVLFDRSHGNRFDNEGVSSFVSAINDAGGEVRFTGITTGFRQGLSGADVLVVIDPATRYDSQDVDAIEQFVADGGRLLIVGEPNRMAIQSSGVPGTLTARRAMVDSLGSAFGISFGSEYLYDMENNDGNFKSVVTSPPGQTDAAAVEGVDTVALYTAATVEVNRGTVLLRTASTAERGNEDTRSGFPVAVQTRSGNVVAVGDKTFLSEQYRTVADNDVFVQRLVEFMVPANHQPGNPGRVTENVTSPAVARPIT